MTHDSKRFSARSGRERITVGPIALLLAALLLGMSAIAAPAADVPDKGGPEKRLEDSLDSDLFDDLKPAQPGPGPSERKDPDAAPPQPGREKPENPASPAIDDDLDRKLRAELGEAGVPEGPEKDPLLLIGERMKAVQKQLAQRDASKATVAGQREIVAELEKLIEQLSKQQQKQSKPSAGSQARSNSKPKAGPMGDKPAGDPMGQPRGDKPATDSREDVDQGKNEQVDVLAAQKARLLKAWGHLPPKLREQLMNATLDEFLPAYERLIEDYYKRLAEDGAEKP